MISLEDLQLASALAQYPSLSAAARMLNVTPPALSMRLKKLEAKLGMSLAVRNSRALALTPEGEALAARARELLDRLEHLPEDLRSGSGELQGRLRIAAPFGFGRAHLADRISEFMHQHPTLEVSLDLLETPWPDGRNADVVIHIGAIKDSSWVCYPIAANERWVCASPGYLETHEAIAHPGDLLKHRCIALRENSEDVTLWHYSRVSPRQGARSPAPKALRVRSALTTNDGEVARRWAQAGLGVILRSEWDVSASVASGALVRLLPDWDFGRPAVVALVAGRTGTSFRVQAFVRFVQQAFRNHTPWRTRQGAEPRKQL